MIWMVLRSDFIQFLLKAYKMDNLQEKIIIYSFSLMISVDKAPIKKCSWQSQT